MRDLPLNNAPSQQPTSTDGAEYRGRPDTHTTCISFSSGACCLAARQRVCFENGGKPPRRQFARSRWRGVAQSVCFSPADRCTASLCMSLGQSLLTQGLWQGASRDN